MAADKTGRPILRPHRLAKRLFTFLPHRRVETQLVHGVAIALGLTIILALGLTVGLLEAMIISSGATAVSLAHSIAAPRRILRLLLLTGLLCISAVAAAVATTYPGLSALGIGLVGFTSLLTMAWGARAGAMSFCPILAFIFAQAYLPLSSNGWVALGWSAVGTGLYVCWAGFTSLALRQFYRARAIDGAIRALSALIRTRANLMADDRETPSSDELTREEAHFAEQLQLARDLIFDDATVGDGRSQAAMLLHVVDVREHLLVIDVDVAALGQSTFSLEFRAHIAHVLQRAVQGLTVDQRKANRLAAAKERNSDGDLARDSAAAEHAHSALNHLWFLKRHLDGIRGLRAGGKEEPLLSPTELRSFLTPQDWKLVALRQNLRMSSPVLGHALRTGIALGCADMIGRLLAWNSHHYWLTLTVAVVLRANLAQTQARHKDRLIGTALGCLMVVAIAQVQSLWILIAVFSLCTALAHGFFFTRYWVTTACVTVLGLLQVLVTAGGSPPIGERLLDTFIGASCALLICHLLPAWERHSLSAAITRALQALARHAELALESGSGRSVAQRLARRSAHEALSHLAFAVQRSAAEPHRVQFPKEPLKLLLQHGREILAHTWASRSILSETEHTIELSNIRNRLARIAQALREDISSTGPAVQQFQEQAALSLCETSDPQHLDQRRLDYRLSKTLWNATRAVDAAREMQSSLRDIKVRA